MKKFIIKVNGSQYEVEVEEVRQEGAEGQAIPQSTPKIQSITPISSQTQIPSSSQGNNAEAAGSTAGNNSRNSSSNNNGGKNNKDNNTAPAGTRAVNSPMPGVIIDINVSEGEAVKKGDILLILEAMKMENEIVSPIDGNVTSVNVAKGASVNAGDLLISIG